MSVLFDYLPHPHLEARRSAGPPTVAAAVTQVHGPGPIGRFNAKVGLRITLVVGTMWAAYLFTVLALVSAPSAFKSGNTSSSWPGSADVPAAGPAAHHHRRDRTCRPPPPTPVQATYDDAVAVLEEAKQIQQHLAAQDAVLARLVEVAGSGPPA